MSMCNAKIDMPPFGTLSCTLSKGHNSDHQCVTRNEKHIWTDEIDELAERRRLTDTKGRKDAIHNAEMRASRLRESIDR